jgi:hypothetical protein
MTDHGTSGQDRAADTHTVRPGLVTVHAAGANAIGSKTGRATGSRYATQNPGRLKPATPFKNTPILQPGLLADDIEGAERVH